MTAHAYVTRDNTGGNFCGHDPLKPRFDLALPANKKMPLILKKLADRLPDFYYLPSAKIPTLAYSGGIGHRLLRSERRESAIQVLKTLLKFCDVASLRVGVPTEEGFKGLTFGTIANHAGISYSRVVRVVQNLKAAGLLTVSKLAKHHEDGTVTGMPAVKAINRHLFGAFGLADMLKVEREKAAKRVRKAAHKFAQVSNRAKARSALILQAMLGKKPKAAPVHEEITRARSLLALELADKYPDKTSDEIRALAAQLAR